MVRLSVHALFTRYIDVVNVAISRHRERRPFELVFDADEKVLDEDDRVSVGVFSDDPSAPHSWFTLQLRDGVFHIVEPCAADPDAAWRIAESHLTTVVDTPLPYLRHPWLLDLDWLRTRIAPMTR